MSRKIHTRWKIDATLNAATPIHVGGMGGDADTDLALAVNGQGKYYIPGTSLAGALRGWGSRPFHNNEPKDDGDHSSLKHPKNPINQLWGFQNKDQGHASFIIVDDAEVSLPNGMTIEIREGVGIDRHTGAAAEKIKYSRAILPKGVSVPLKITLDCQTSHDPDELWTLLMALEQGDIRIGAAKTRGLGKVSLQAITIEKHDLNNGEGLFKSLLRQKIQQDWKQIKDAAIQRVGDYKPPDRLSLSIAWKPRDPVMVKTEGDGIAVDILPLVSQVSSGVRFVIPGSSIKGVLRAHAERIVRTVCNISPTPDKFLEQIKLSLVNEVFGSAEQSSKGNGSKQQFNGKKGSLSVDDCYATLPMKTDHWASVENAPKGETFASFKTKLKTAVNSADNPFQILQPAMHVAVDRWTGGAADGMLYSVLEPIGVEWEEIGIQLDVKQLQNYDSSLVQPAITLLLLVLRDFANRKIPIGYGTNRGMGTIEVTEMCMNCSPIEELTGIERETAIAPDLSNFNDQVLSDLTTAWQTWISQHQEAA